MKKTAYEKQVKRRISARSHLFFTACSPGLIRLCQTELIKTGVEKNDMVRLKGGIELSCKPDLCMALHLSLGSATRILMRIARFKADNFLKFEKKLSGIEWDLYLPQGCCPDFKVNTKRSTLYHSGALTQRAQRIITEKLGVKKQPSLGPSFQTVYIRALNNEFEISLNCTGDPLYKRGIKSKVTPAPLRETLAFAMLHWAGFTPQDPLLDPMCGSGTFSLEAALIKKNIPPGFFRTFAFESWPGFSPQTFSWQKKQAEKSFYTDIKNPIWAFDTSRRAIDALEANRNQPRNNPLICDIIRTGCEDFFSLSPGRFKRYPKGVIMLNPPYGKRLGSPRQTLSFYSEIAEKLRLDFKGWRVGIIIPDLSIYQAMAIKLDLKPIFHGGLDLFAGIGII